MLYVYVSEPLGRFYTSLSIVAKDLENAKSLMHLVNLCSFKKEGDEHWQQDGWGATVVFDKPLTKLSLEKRLSELKKDIRYLHRKSKVTYLDRNIYNGNNKVQKNQDNQVMQLRSLYWQSSYGGDEYVLLDTRLSIPSLGLYGEVGDYLLKSNNRYMVVLASDIKDYIGR